MLTFKMHVNTAGITLIHTFRIFDFAHIVFSIFVQVMILVKLTFLVVVGEVVVEVTDIVSDKNFHRKD